MDIEELKDDMIALRSESEAVAEQAHEAIVHISELFLQAGKLVEDLSGSQAQARQELAELKAAVDAWVEQASSSRLHLIEEMDALDGALDEQLPLLETGRKAVADGLHETSDAAASFKHDLQAEAPHVQDAEKEATTALEALGHAAQEGEQTLKQSVEAVQQEAQHLEDRVESGTTEVSTDLETLKHTMDTLAQQAERTVGDVDTELGQDVEALTTAVADAVQTLEEGHEQFLSGLGDAVTARLEEWRHAAQEAVDATNELVSKADEATHEIESATQSIDNSFSVTGLLKGTLNKLIDEVKQAALTAGISWICEAMNAEDLKFAVSEALAQVRGLKTLIDGLEAEVAEKKGELETVEHERVEASQRLEAACTKAEESARKGKDEMKAAGDSAHEAVVAARQSVLTHAAQAEKALDESHQATAALHTEVGELDTEMKASLDQVTKEIRDLAHQATTLKGEVDHAVQEADHLLQEEAQGLQRLLQEVNTHVEQVRTSLRDECETPIAQEDEKVEIRIDDLSRTVKESFELADTHAKETASFSVEERARELHEALGALENASHDVTHALEALRDKTADARGKAVKAAEDMEKALGDGYDKLDHAIHGLDSIIGLMAEFGFAV